MELEARRVLSADFALGAEGAAGAEGLLLYGFDEESTSLTITSNANEYQFTLNSGNWNGSGAGARVDGSTLTIDSAALDNGLRVVATKGTNLGVLFGNADFSSVSGGVELIGVSSLGQLEGTQVTSPESSPVAAVTPGTGLVITDMNLSGDFSVEFNGAITDAPGANIYIDGDATFVSRPGVLPVGDLNYDGVINGEDIALWNTGYGTASAESDLNNDTVVSAADFTVLRDLAGMGSEAGINLANDADDSLTVIGKATFIAQSEDASNRFHIDVGLGVNSTEEEEGGATVEFGSLSAFGGKTNLFESNGPATPDGTVLDDTNVTSLHLSSAGAITDTGSTDVAVAGLADLRAVHGDAITLDDIYDFGSLTVNGGDVTIVEQSGTRFFGHSFVQGLLDIDSAGPITDSDDSNTVIEVIGNASFTSTTGGSITLDETNSFGSLTVNGGDVTIVENDGIDDGAAAVAPSVSASIFGRPSILLTGTNLASSLNLRTNGTIEDEDGVTTVTVLGNATFTAAGFYGLRMITLDDLLNFGSLTFTGDEVTITEASGTVLSGTSRASSFLNLTSADSIIDDGTVELNAGAASFTSVAGAAITLDDTYRFGTLSLNGGDVVVHEADSTDLAGVAVATLVINSQGDINDIDDSEFNVVGNASFIAAGDIRLFPNASLGTLTFDGQDVRIFEQDSIVLSGVSNASHLLLASNQSITDDGTANVTVTNHARFSAGINTQDITLDDTYNFGTLTFRGRNVTIVEDSDVNLFGESQATNLDLSANGNIRDNDPGFNGQHRLFVVNVATFQSITGETIALDDDVNFGALNFMGGDVTIAESSDTVLTGMSRADTLDLDSTGTITDDGTADVNVVGNASFNADSDRSYTASAIELDDAYNFGTLTFHGSEVTIVEASSTELVGDSLADTLSLRSLGSITDAEDATLFVTTTGQGSATITADGSIVLADAGAANMLAIFDATFEAGQGPASGDDILVGVDPSTGALADATFLLNFLTFNAPGTVQFGADGNLALLEVVPDAADAAFAELGEGELAAAFDDLSDDLAA